MRLRHALLFVVGFGVGLGLLAAFPVSAQPEVTLLNVSYDRPVDLPRPRERGTATFAELEGPTLDRVMRAESQHRRPSALRGRMAESVRDPVAV